MLIQRQIILAIVAVILIGLSLWVHLGSGGPGYQAAVMTRGELDGLKADAEGDARLLEELRREAGMDLAAWRDLPDPGRPLFATLWAEEVQRNGSWAQMVEVDPAEQTGPSLADVASAYDALGFPENAAAVRRLATLTARDQRTMQTWIAAMREGRHLPRPDMRELERAARLAFGHLDAVRGKRLSFARQHADELGIR